MKFLVDHQLPVALARWLAAQGTGTVHVLDAGLDTTPGADIWVRALAEDRIVVQKDADFFHLANRLGDPDRLLWVRVGNCRTAALLARLTPLWPDIQQAFASGQRIVEVR